MSKQQSKMRLDNLLAERGLFASRSRARDAVLRGTVRVDGAAAAKPGLFVAADAKLETADPARSYVSRAALKLAAGLDAFNIDARGCRAADIGCSTGGFCQVLLERGAAHITAIDVGQGQMHPSLCFDPRIKLYEGLNARYLTAAHFCENGADSAPDLPNLIVSDVSFISLKLALPPALELAVKGAKAVLLVKPQFEAGRANIGKDGQLKDEAQAELIGRELYGWLDNFPHWRACGLLPSPILGGEGAREFLLYGEKIG